MDELLLYLFEKSPGALGLYEALEGAVLQAVPQAGRRVQKTQVTFTCPRVFACASLLRPKSAKKLPRPYLTVTFGLGRRAESPRIAAAVEPYPGRWTHHVVIGSPGDIDGELLGWIKEAAAFSAGKGRGGPLPPPTAKPKGAHPRPLTRHPQTIPRRSSMAFIEIKNVGFSYDAEPGAAREVLHGIDLQIEEGQFVALLGHNGCGKSTMAKLLNGMLTPVSGQVLINGLDTALEENQLPVRRQVGLVLQNPDNQLVAGIVEEDVAFGPENLGVPPQEIRRRVDAALKAVDMYHYRGHAPHKLSGGQKQRVAIAGVIAMETRCIVLDEPTAMLDPQGRVEVMETITRLNREKGITIVLITHYMDEAVQAGRVVVMDEGRVLMDGTPRQVFSQVERLKRHGLDVPQATELCYRLRAAGVDLPGIPLSVEECMGMFRQLLDKGAPA